MKGNNIKFIFHIRTPSSSKTMPASRPESRSVLPLVANLRLSIYFSTVCHCTLLQSLSTSVTSFQNNQITSKLIQIISVEFDVNNLN